MPDTERQERVQLGRGKEPRRLPTWFVLGGMRCGTGALHRALRQHPDVHASERKEIRFFDLRFSKGEGGTGGTFRPRARRGRERKHQAGAC